MEESDESGLVASNSERSKSRKRAISLHDEDLSSAEPLRGDLKAPLSGWSGATSAPVVFTSDDTEVLCDHPESFVNHFSPEINDNFTTQGCHISPIESIPLVDGTQVRITLPSKADKISLLTDCQSDQCFQVCCSHAAEHFLNCTAVSLASETSEESLETSTKDEPFETSNPLGAAHGVPTHSNTLRSLLPPSRHKSPKFDSNARRSDRRCESDSELYSRRTVRSAYVSTQGSHFSHSSNGPSQLRDGPSQLRDGPSQLRDGPSQLRDGPSQLRDGPSQLRDGPSQLRDGPSQLRDGPSRYYPSNGTQRHVAGQGESHNSGDHPPPGWISAESHQVSRTNQPERSLRHSGKLPWSPGVECLELSRRSDRSRAPETSKETYLSDDCSVSQTSGTRREGRSLLHRPSETGDYRSRRRHGISTPPQLTTSRHLSATERAGRESMNHHGRRPPSGTFSQEVPVVEGDRRHRTTGAPNGDPESRIQRDPYPRKEDLARELCRRCGAAIRGKVARALCKMSLCVARVSMEVYDEWEDDSTRRKAQGMRRKVQSRQRGETPRPSRDNENHFWNEEMRRIRRRHYTRQNGPS